MSRTAFQIATRHLAAPLLAVPAALCSACGSDDVESLLADSTTSAAQDGTSPSSDLELDAATLREEANRDLVRRAVTGVLGQGDPAALNLFAEDYSQHNPAIANGREALRQAMVDNRPDGFTYEIGTVLAEGDFVALHSRFEGVGIGPGVAVDLYKVEEGLILAHWDVFQDEVPASESVNGNAMFPIEAGTEPSNLESSNRAIVVQAMERLFGESDLTVLDEFWAEDYTQHNPLIPNGTAALKDFLTGTEEIGFELGLAMAYGDLVLTHSRYLLPGLPPTIGADIFRLEEGVIVEHWDVLQEEVPASESVSGNAMFPIE